MYHTEHTLTSVIREHIHVLPPLASKVPSQPQPDGHHIMPPIRCSLHITRGASNRPTDPMDSFSPPINYDKAIALCYSNFCLFPKVPSMLKLSTSSILYPVQAAFFSPSKSTISALYTEEQRVGNTLSVLTAFDILSIMSSSKWSAKSTITIASLKAGCLVVLSYYLGAKSERRYI